jgi:hypothetical protein
VCGVCGGDGTQCDDCLLAHTPMSCSSGGAVSRAASGGWECDDGSTVVFSGPGPNYEDECGTCDADADNDCTLDCQGVWGGPAVVYDCVLADGSPFTLCDVTCESVGGYQTPVTFLDECTRSAIASVDVDANTITLPAVDTTIVAGQTLQLVTSSAAGATCGLQPLASALTVASVDGAVITFSTDLTAPDSALLPSVSTACELLRQVDPCPALATLPTGGLSIGSVQQQQQCPVRLVCDDSATIVVPNVFSCSCPACTDVVITDTPALASLTLMKSYLETHPAMRHFVVSAVQGQEGQACKDTSRSGCMDETAFNYDPTAFTPAPDTCITRVWGCPEGATATNSVVGSNSYDHTDTDTQCRGVYCSADGTQAGIIEGESPTRSDASSPWTCATAGATAVAYGTGGGELPAYDECSTDPCNDPGDLAASLASADPSVVFTCDQPELGDTPRSWQCSDPNLYWRGDYTCSCAVDSATSSYVSSVLSTCGAEELVTTDSGIVLSNYEVTEWLSTSTVQRRQLCFVATGRVDCVFATEVSTVTVTAASSGGSGR